MLDEFNDMQHSLDCAGLTALCYNVRVFLVMKKRRQVAAVHNNAPASGN